MFDVVGFALRIDMDALAGRGVAFDIMVALDHHRVILFAAQTVKAAARIAICKLHQKPARNSKPHQQ